MAVALPDGRSCVAQVLEDEINALYSNKVRCAAFRGPRRSSPRRMQVIAGVGLCIALYDLVEVGEQLLYPGDAAAHIAGASPPSRRRAEPTDRFRSRPQSSFDLLCFDRSRGR